MMLSRGNPDRAATIENFLAGYKNARTSAKGTERKPKRN